MPATSRKKEQSAAYIKYIYITRLDGTGDDDTVLAYSFPELRDVEHHADDRGEQSVDAYPRLHFSTTGR